MVKPNAVFRYLFYKPPGQDHAVDVCEIGIVGEFLRNAKKHP